MGNILLIDDSQDIVSLVQKTLEYGVTVAASILEAKMALSVSSYDLILLDAQLPDGNGFDFLKSIRNIILTPVIMLTCIADSETKAHAFEMGVEDYIVKPFCRVEFKARVERRLQGARPMVEPPSSMVTFGALTIDKDLNRALVKGQAVDLTSIEFKILTLLANNAGEACAREMIFEKVWTDHSSNIRAVDTHVSKLRKKLGSELIQSVHGVGYRLAV